MKKTLWIAIAGALAASVIAASAQTEVLSGNAVGYIKRTVPAAGKLAAVAHPLNSMSAGTLMFTNTSIATEMPNGSWAYFWNPITQKWVGSQKSGKGAWDGVAQEKEVLTGEMFFLKTPAIQVTDVAVTITGEVPDEQTLTRAVQGNNAIAALGNPYPVDVAFTNMDVAKNAANSSWAYFWNNDTQRWVGSQKSGKGAWDGVAQAKTVQAGEGFFLKDFGPGSVWTNSKPYTWP